MYKESTCENKVHLKEYQIQIWASTPIGWTSSCCVRHFSTLQSVHWKQLLNVSKSLVHWDDTSHSRWDLTTTHTSGTHTLYLQDPPHHLTCCQHSWPSWSALSAPSDEADASTGPEYEETSQTNLYTKNVKKFVHRDLNNINSRTCIHVH